MTKQELIKTAVALVSAYPQNSGVGGGNTIFTTSAEAFYNIKVPAAMENFIYGFGISSFTLANPEISEADSDYKIFNIPDNVGFIFTVCRFTDLPKIQALIGVRGLRKLGGVFFSKLKNDKIQIYHPEVYQENNLVIGFIKTNPAVSTMSSLFREFIIHDIAQQLALKNIQQQAIQSKLEIQAHIYKRQAQKFALDNSNLYNYEHVNLAEAPFIREPYREDKTQSRTGYTRSYFRGV